MKRFSAAVLLFAANAAFAQLTITEPVPLAPGPLGATPRAVVSSVAAQSASSYLVAWYDGTLRLQRFALSGEPLDAIPALTGLALEPRSAASDGDSFVIVAANPGRGGPYAIHVDRDGHASAPVPLPNVGLGEIISNGRDYLAILGPGVDFGGHDQPPIIVRLDRDGHPMSQATPTAAWPHGARVLAISGTYSLVWLDFQNAVHAARIDDGGNPVDERVLERFATLSYIAVTARPGELAVASSSGDDGIRLSLFDADLKSKDSVIIDATPKTIPSAVTWDGAGYVLRLQSLDPPYPWRLLSFRGTTARQLPMPATMDYVVDLCGGLRYWIDKRHSVKQLFAIVDDGAETLVSISDTEQRLPRLLRFGSSVAASWVETTADGDVVLAALLDGEGHITKGPVQVASTPQKIVALDAATDGTTLFVVWDFEAILLDSSLSILERWGDTNLRGVAPDPAGYLVFGLDYYGTSVQRYDRHGRQWGGALPLDAHFDEMRITAEDRGWLLVENGNVYCSECYGLWQITLAHISAAFPPAVVSSISFPTNSTLAASVRTSAGILLFFDRSTELRASDDFRLLASHAVASRRLGFPYQPGDAVVAGGRVIAAIGDGLEVLTPEGERLGSLPIGAGVTESRLLASTRLTLVHDAPTATGSRRFFLRFVDETPPHRRAGAH